MAGFRVMHSLAWGHYLYVDDLSTLPEARRRGHARALLDWLLEEGGGSAAISFTSIPASASTGRTPTGST